MRLLPSDPSLGWTPYIWLVYTAFYVVYPFLFGPGVYGWFPHAAGLLVFVALYFGGHWVEGNRRVGVIVALTALGVAMSSVNPGALVFFIYATSFVGGVRTGRTAALWIAAITAVGLATAWAIGWRQWPILGSVAIFTPMIGAVNVQHAATRRRDAALRLAQDEIARLAVQAERHRIAADLHDVLGHTLSVVVLKAELAARLLERDPIAARTEMQEVERIAREALASTRKVVTGIQASTLADELLRARTVLESAGIVVTLDPPTGRPDVSLLPAGAEHALAMVLREAVTNVLRHAQATTCRITCANGTLEVEDNGRGAEVREGNGIRGMRARLAEVGGRIDVRAGTGVSVVATVPVAGGGR